ncbi:MAG: hypothetical protein U0797_16565 [Gemmataceae bacterium]
MPLPSIVPTRMVCPVTTIALTRWPAMTFVPAPSSPSSDQVAPPSLVR